MMGLLDSIMQADAVNVFCNANEFAEQITYNSNSKGTIAPSTINAVVYRFGPTNLPGTEVATPHIEIEIPNSATGGVTSINKNGDTVLVADKQGGTPTVHTVNEILSQDAGMWRLSLR